MTQALSQSPGSDLKAIGLIGLAHGCSHFFQLVLPPLFPFLIAEFQLSYTELGVMMTVFFVTSGLAQPPAGFLVDRIGARRVLIGGLALYCVAIGLVALLPSFWMFLPAMALIGLGNSVFHPADFTILNTTVSQHRLGRAFGVHTFGGNIGWAIAPILMLPLAGQFGWRIALFGAVIVGLCVLILLWINRASLLDGSEIVGQGRRPFTRLGLRPLLAAPVLLCFLYFLLLATALIAVQNFLPATLGALHQTPLTLASAALTGFLLGAAGGVVVGGFLADRSTRHTAIIAGGLAAAAILLLAVGHVPLPAAILLPAVAAAGFLAGVTTPSRDLLVRSATPPGATGRVFGFVYSGLDAGSALAPATVGLILDHGRPEWVLWLVAAVMICAIFTAVSIRAEAAAPPNSAAR